MPDHRPLFSRRLRRAELVALDVVAAAGLTLLGAFGALDETATTGFDGPTWLGWLVAAGFGLPVAARRLWPLAALGVMLAALLAASALKIAWGPSGIAFVLPLAVGLYMVGLAVSGRRSAGALVACLLCATAGVAVTAATAQRPLPRDAPDLIGVVALLSIMGASWAFGRAVRERRAYAQRSVEQLTQQAVTDERLRIARELHDVVAHSLSLIAVKAGIANHVAATRPDETRDALAVIETTSRETLTEMRRLLGVLRSDNDTDTDTDAELAPAPDLTGLAALAEQASVAGVRVDLDVRAPRDLPEGVALSTYRIVQEALTNVIKHAAPARCRVRVRADRGELLIDVADDGPGTRQLGPSSAGPGHGLIGMRERVMLYGGWLAAGPRPTGGFAVSARLPYAPGSVDSPIGTVP